MEGPVHQALECCSGGCEKGSGRECERERQQATRHDTKSGSQSTPATTLQDDDSNGDGLQSEATETEGSE